MKIELVDTISKLEDTYRETVERMIKENKITLDEWNGRFKDYRDSCGYSIIHYFEAHSMGVEVFITINPIMLKNRGELSERFNVSIMTPEEAMKEEKE